MLPPFSFNRTTCAYNDVECHKHFDFTTIHEIARHLRINFVGFGCLWSSSNIVVVVE